MRRSLLVLLVMILSLCRLSSAQEAGNDVAAALRLGEAKYAEKDYRGAIAVFTAVIESEPGNARAFLLRGGARTEIGDAEGSIADHSRASQLDPGNGQIYKELIELTRSLMGAPREETEYYHRGNRKFDLEDFHGAIADYTRALKLDPGDGEAYYNRGLAKLRVGAYRSGAVEDFTKAIQCYRGAHMPLDGAFHNRGRARLKLKDYRGAIADLNQVVQLVQSEARKERARGRTEGDLPSVSSDLFVERGEAHAGLKEYRNAITDYSKAIEIDSTNAVAFQRRGSAYYSLGQKVTGCDDIATARRLGAAISVGEYPPCQ
jgi:tetratricopeptide (TPR) repeat protein